MLTPFEREATGQAPDIDGHDLALRHLFFLSLDPEITFEAKVARLLDLGCAALGLPLGIVSRIEGDSYRVEHVRGPDWAPAAGMELDLADTYCALTLASDGVKHFHHAGKSQLAEHPCYSEFGIESYIGVPLREGATRVGTINFSGPDPRTPFTPQDAEFIDLLGRWLEQEGLKERRTRELADQTMVLDAIIDTVPDVILTVDLERRITRVNRAAERTFGRSREEMIGQTTEMLYTDEDAFRQHGESIYRLAKRAGAGRLEMLARRSSGETFPAEVFIAPLRQQGGPRIGLLSVIRDVTEQKAVEAAREELVSTVSHELRQPITSAQASVRLIRAEKHNLSPALQPTLDIAARNLDRVERLVRDILDFERLRAGQGKAELRPVALAALLAQARDDIHPFAAQHGVEVRVVPGPAGLAEILGDEIRLIQVLSNLMSNAIKASQTGGKVEIGLTEARPGFWVRDNGPGIPAELQPRLYERFTRAPESYAKGQSGSGLGLGIAKMILESHDATLAFETAPGAGTTFTVNFPGEAGA